MREVDLLVGTEMIQRVMDAFSLSVSLVVMCK